MIAPQRIDAGMQNYLAEDQQIWGDTQAQTWRLQQFKFLKNMRVWSDYLSYQWQSKVVGYDAEKQKNWLSKLGFNSSYSYVLILIIGIAGILAVYVGFYWWRQTRQQALYQRIVIQFQKQLPKHLHKKPAETFQVWMLRLSSVSSDQQSFQQVVVLYQKIVFLEQDSQQNIQEFRKLLKVCSIEIKQSQNNL